MVHHVTAPGPGYNPLDPEAIMTADIDGNGKVDVIMDFGAAGLWAWTGTNFFQLHPFSPEGMAAVDLNGR